MVEQNKDSIIITAHHYVLKDTTVASGEWEGMTRTNQGGWKAGYHGYFPEGTPQGASYLYQVDSKPDSRVFERVLEVTPSPLDLWLGGHTHTAVEDTYGGGARRDSLWHDVHERGGADQVPHVCRNGNA
jgi:hypothetical protein